MMPELTAAYTGRAETWMLITTLTYFMMNGAQIFETAVLVPKWGRKPPESFHYFRGPYRMDLKTFWIAAHTVHEVTFLLAIGFSWKMVGVRYALLLLFGLHFAVRVWTILYFAPNIMDFEAIANGKDAGTGIARRVQLWRQLNYVRVGAFVLLSVAVAAVYSAMAHG